MINQNEKNRHIEQIENELKQFTCTDGYHRFSSIFRNFLLTDGARHVAERCEAYWLFDLIASHQGDPKVKNHPQLKDAIQFWTLKVRGQEAEAICEWDKGQIVTKQKIEFTDFPLPEIRVWVSRTRLKSGQIAFIAYLPSEH